MESSYEIATRKIVPLVRSALVNELIYKYNKTEDEVANILGITQAAISKKIKNNELRKKLEGDINIDNGIIEDYAKKIIDGSETAQRCICKICNSVNDFGCVFSSLKK